MTVVTVNVAGVYLDKNRRALPFAEVGAQIDIASGPYMQTLIDQGLVTAVDDGVFPAPAPVKPKVMSGKDDPLAVPDKPVPTLPPAPPVAEKKVAEAAVAVDDDDPVVSLSEVKGIGKITAEKLVEAGIRSKLAFVQADAVDLSEVLETSIARVQGWQLAAQGLIDG